MKLVLLLLLISCGKLNVKTQPVQINHNFNTEGLFEFCENLGGTNFEVEQCKRDLLAAIARVGSTSND